MPTVTFNAETAKGCLLVDGCRIIGYPNNRDGRRAYERDLKKGKGMMRITEPTEDDNG